MTDAPLYGSPTVRSVADAVSKHYGVDMKRLLERRRNNPYVMRARQVAHFLAAEITTASLPTIGRVMLRDHTTIMSSRMRIKGLTAAGPGAAGARPRRRKPSGRRRRSSASFASCRVSGRP